MTILLDRSTRIVLHGAELRAARFQIGEMARYGSTIVGAVAARPGPIDPPLPDGTRPFATVTEAVASTGADLLLVFTPRLEVKDVVIEALAASIKTIVCLTDDVPLYDALEIKERAKRAGAVLLGPNSTGLLSPGVAKAGYYSEDVCLPGRIGVMSKSGSLAYAVMSEMMSFGLGISTIAGVGGDPVRGASYAELLPLFEDDPGTDAIVLLGEIGGDDEERAARAIEGRIKKPVVAFIAGRSVPLGHSMGHAGAIARHGRGDYASKTAALRAAGVHIADNIGDVAQVLKGLELPN
jgi:succinyl-CoA synthetase alpha subunit